MEILLICYFLIIIDYGHSDKSTKNTEEDLHWNGTMLSDPELWCQIPNYDHMDWLSKQTEPLPKPVQCIKEEFSSVSNGVIFINNTKLLSHARKLYPLLLEEDIKCCMHDVRRGLMDNSDTKNIDMEFTLGPCKPISGPQTVSSEFVEVRCLVNDTDIYRSVHYSIAARTTNWTEKDYARFNRDALRPSVLILGIDSVSRLNSMRYLPLLRSTLKKIGAIEMNMFNKVADNTFPNVMAMISGLAVEDAKSRHSTEDSPKGSGCWSSDMHTFDECPFLWDRYSDLGYATLFIEDEPKISTFNHYRGGFVKVPVDFYGRPLFLAASKDLEVTRWQENNVCYGPSATNDMILGYTMEFISWATKNKVPFFSLSWLSSRTHGHAPSLSLEDKVVSKFIEEVTSLKVEDGLMIVMMSDHGLRYGPVRQSVLGWFEERTPFLFIKPPGGTTDHSALAINSRRLTSTFDIHTTLSSLIPGGVERNSCPKCVNLLTEEVPISRTCKDAGIPHEWCACNDRTIDLNDETLHSQLASLLVSSINEIIKPNRKFCAPLSVSKVMSAELLTRKVARVKFVANPGSMVFEGRLILNRNEDWIVLGLVRRISKYAGISDCVEHPTLKNYCYCLNMK